MDLSLDDRAAADSVVVAVRGQIDVYTAHDLRDTPRTTSGTGSLASSARGSATSSLTSKEWSSWTRLASGSS